MKLEDALATCPDGLALTTPYLLFSRHCYIVKQAPHLPLKLHNFLTGLSIDWCPSINELNSTDWMVSTADQLRAMVPA